MSGVYNHMLLRFGAFSEYRANTIVFIRQVPDLQIKRLLSATFSKVWGLLGAFLLKALGCILEKKDSLSISQLFPYLLVIEYLLGH